MGKGPRFAQNGEVPSETVAPGRQRPEEILAQTLTAAPHPEATDGWSPRGRRLFLVALAVAGVVLLAAGLLVTSNLGPGPGRPTPLESGPGNGLADQLLRPVTEEGVTTPPTTILPLPLTPTAVTPAGTSRPQTPGSVTRQPAPTADNTDNGTTPTTAPVQGTTTTLPCGILGQGLQSAQIPFPCQASTNSPLG
jgi:hypothetical protein